MRLKGNCFQRCVITFIGSGVVLFFLKGPLPGAPADTLKTAYQLTRQAEKLSKSPHIKSKLKETSKAIKNSTVFLKKKDTVGALKSMKSGARLLEELLNQGDARDETLDNTIKKARNNLLAAIRAAGEFKTASTIDKGLHTVVLSSTMGEVYVNFPGDIGPGDRISSGVDIYPGGKGEALRQQNGHLLRQYTVEIEEIDNSRRVLSGEWSSWDIPGNLPANIHLSFKDENGIEMAGHSLPVRGIPRESTGKKSGFQMSPVGQAGDYLRISGPFDGDFNNSTLRVGDYTARLLAESPDRLIARIPVEMTGETEVRLKEGNEKIVRKFRVVSVALSAPKLLLKSGEQTVLTIIVKGLKELDKKLPFRLHNQSSTVIGMDGGDSQFFYIAPEDAAPGGVFTLNRRLTGRIPGGFRISARLKEDMLETVEREGDTTQTDEWKEVDLTRKKHVKRQ